MQLWSARWKPVDSVSQEIPKSTSSKGHICVETHLPGKCRLTDPVQTHSWTDVKTELALGLLLHQEDAQTDSPKELNGAKTYSLLINVYAVESKHCHVECSDVGKQLFQRRSGCPPPLSPITHTAKAQ